MSQHYIHDPFLLIYATFSAVLLLVSLCVISYLLIINYKLWKRQLLSLLLVCVSFACFSLENYLMYRFYPQHNQAGGYRGGPIGSFGVIMFVSGCYLFVKARRNHPKALQ